MVEEGVCGGAGIGAGIDETIAGGGAKELGGWYMLFIVDGNC
jgi:hypothetical protein